MQNLKISSIAEDIASRSVVISGAARSGTTIVGKLVGSLRSVEYTFEPPTILLLLTLINILPREHWKLIYSGYLYEDFFVNALAGRRLNMNKHDDSSVFQQKTWQEIDNRLSKSLTKKDAEGLIGDATVAYKIPGILQYLEKLQDYFPNTKVIIVRRNPSAVIRSLLRKNWFSEESMKQNLVWPFRYYRDIKIPHWVDEDDDERWTKLSEIDRCGYYYFRTYERLDRILRPTIVEYEELVANPQKVASDLCDSLELQMGDKTPDILKSIKSAHEGQKTALLEKLEPDIKAQVQAV